MRKSRAADSEGDKVNTLKENFDFKFSTNFKLLKKIEGTVINFYDLFQVC